MVVYADPSFLFSLYAQDANTAQAAATVGALAASVVFTPLQRYELRNALRLSVFHGAATAEECHAVLANIEDDARAGVLVESPVAWAEVFDQAEALSAAHTATLGTRATDILHVASAVALGVKDFFTFDIRRKTLAHKAGMTVRPEWMRAG